MIAAILFVISLAALGQFGLYYWRAIVAGVATQPLSERVRTAAGLASASLGAADFHAVMSLHDLAPRLKDDNGSLWFLRAYYGGVAILGRLAGHSLPRLAAWTQREMTTCSRYVAVRVDQRLEHNMACAAEARSS